MYQYFIPVSYFAISPRLNLFKHVFIVCFCSNLGKKQIRAAREAEKTEEKVSKLLAERLLEFPKAIFSLVNTI